MFGKIKYWNKYKNSYINRLQKISNAKQINSVKNIRVELWKYKAVKYFEI